MSDGAEQQERQEPEQHWTAGETALLITVPEADPLLGGARQKYDPAAGAGVPAHVTVLYPFLPADRIGAEVLAELRALFAGHAAFELDFAEFGRFPELLWLAPVPDAPVRGLTAAVEARWPEAPPYGGRFDDPVPHLTIAGGQSAETYDALEREFAPGLPLRTRVAGVHLVVNDGTRWQLRETFPLGASAGEIGETGVGVVGDAGGGAGAEIGAGAEVGVDAAAESAESAALAESAEPAGTGTGIGPADR